MTRGGKSRGVETLECGATNLAVAAEQDYDKRVALNATFADFMRKWIPNTGVVSWGNPFIYNPNTIDRWEPVTGWRGDVDTWSNVFLKK